MKRKLTAILLALLMVLSLVPAVVLPKTAVADAQPIDQAIVQGGAILHCFDWSYNEIRAALPDIAAAGYVAVQTSPVQQPKDYNKAWSDTRGNWWKLYQPLGLRVAPDVEHVQTSWLGTKEDLAALCEEAENYHIYVIVDIVANHLANDGADGGTFANLNKNVDDDMKVEAYYHSDSNGIDYSQNDNRYNITQRHMGMPDLNTGNSEVQQKVLGLLEECIDCGVDGFRFDAAKHIEVPEDPEIGSQFWPTVVEGARSYAATPLFMYGEILSDVGTDPLNYTKYIALTDNVTGNNAREYAVNQNAGGLAINGYNKGSAAKSCVLWVESHDTYLNDGTDGVPSDTIVKAWAIVGARSDSTALFLARPNETMGLASTDTSWKSPAVAAVNKFKTYYKGTGEYLSYDQNAKVTWIERGESGNAGVSISKLDGAGAVSLGVKLMSDGYYVDEVTGNIFTVSNHTISGNVGPTGVAVVYKTTTYTPPTPSEYITADPIYLVPGVWNTADAWFEMYVFNDNDKAWVTMTDPDGDGTFEAALPAGNWKALIFVRMAPGSDAGTWTGKWNQTANLVPDAGCDTFTITGWGGDNNPDPGTWSASGGTPDPNAGYYIVGSMTGWAVLPEYKMTRTGASTEEYSIILPLQRTSNYYSQFKVVYSPDGVTKQTWYPGGENNNYGDDYDEEQKTGEIATSGIYKVYFRPGYDGGSDWHNNCIYAELSEYYVSVSDADKNGVVKVDKNTAASGETVTVTVTPHTGYELDTLIYEYERTPNTGNMAQVTIEGNSFTMPAYNVTVKATFKKATKPQFASHSLTLDGKIGVNFYMYLSMLSAEDLADAEKTYMTFTISGKGTVSSDPVPVNTAKRNRSETLYCFTCYVNSIQMADTITATFHYGDDQTVTENYSAEMYIKSFEKVQSQYSDEIVALVHALADYGHYMQLFLAEAKGWELNDGEEAVDDQYAAMDTYYTVSYDLDSVTASLSSYAISASNSDTNIKSLTFTVVFDSETTIRLILKPVSDFTGDLYVRVVGGKDSTVSLKSKRWTVEIPNIAAHQLGDAHEILARTDNSGGSTWTSCITVSNLSVMSYALQLLNGNEAAQNAGAAIYYYWRAAKALKEAQN